MQMEKHTNGLAGVSNGDSFETKVHVAPRIAGDTIDSEYVVKEYAVENPIVEECQEKLAVLGVKSTNVDGGEDNGEDQKPGEYKTLGTPIAKSDTNGHAHINFTVPKPFTLATEKRGSCVTRHVETESPVSVKSPKANNLNSPFKSQQVVFISFQPSKLEPWL